MTTEVPVPGAPVGIKIGKLEVSNPMADHRCTVAAHPSPSCVVSFANMATSTRASARARSSQNMAETNMPRRSGQSVTVIAWIGATISRTSTRAMIQRCHF